MSDRWPSVPLSRLLSKSEEWVSLEPDAVYQEITVRLWGKGVIERRKTTGAEIAAGRRIVARAGQFILSRIDARNGALGLVPDELDGAVVSNDFPVFDLRTTWLFPSYMAWLSRTHTFVDLCRAASEGTTNRVRLQETRFLTTEIPLPPLDEQHRIVARVAELAARIDEARGLRREAIQEANALVEARARAVLTTVTARLSMLQDWLDPVRGTIQTGPFGAQLGGSDFVDEGKPILTIGNVQYTGLDIGVLRHVSEAKARELDRYILCEGDILFARMGTVGRSCVIPRMAAGWLYNYHLIRVAVDQARVDPRYILWTIQASEAVEHFLSSRIRGATREGVNSNIVGELPCRIPPLHEQRRIVAYLDDLQARVDALKRLQAETAAELDRCCRRCWTRRSEGSCNTRQAATCVRHCRSDHCAGAAFVLFCIYLPRDSLSHFEPAGVR